MNVPAFHSKEFSVGWVKQADKMQNNWLFFSVTIPDVTN
jgi:hypothetical protein